MIAIEVAMSYSRTCFSQTLPFKERTLPVESGQQRSVIQPGWVAKLRPWAETTRSLKHFL